MKGFSLTEILIVVAVVGLLLVFTLPMSIDFYRTQQLDTIAEEVVQALRGAQLKAMSMNNDSAWTVYFESGQYRLEDELFSLPSGILISGTNQVIFSKLDGLPSYVGNIAITNGQNTKTININSQGRIQFN